MQSPGMLVKASKRLSCWLLSILLPSIALAMMDDDGRVEELYAEKNEIERELLRRWKAGDEGARIEAFAGM